MNLRLVSKDGFTHVYNRDTGEEIKDCVKAVFTHTVDEGPRLEVTVADFRPELEIDSPGSAEIVDVTTIGDRYARPRRVAAKTGAQSA